jgi:hypothetical protein
MAYLGKEVTGNKSLENDTAGAGDDGVADAELCPSVSFGFRSAHPSQINAPDYSYSCLVTLVRVV